MAKKPHLNLVFIGHVDHGKSTSVGHLLYKVGVITQQQIDKHKKTAESIGRQTWEFAFVMDKLKEEKERGITIDLSHMKFETQKYYFTIIDAPGHRDFVKNMITGASQADAAVLVVSAKDGIQEQTREHVFLAKTLGVEQLIVFLNKMDAVDFKESEFNKVKGELEKLLKQLGYKQENLTYVPGSGLNGDNLVEKSDKMPWWKGPTLLQALDMLKEPPKPVDKPLRLPIQDVFSITGVGTVPVGRVETGVLKVGDTLIFNPSGSQGEVKSIEMHHEAMNEAVPGDNIGFNIRGIDKGALKRGDVGGHTSSPPTIAKEFTAQIVILNHPTAVTIGYTPVFHAHTAQQACRFTELVSKKDPRTGQASAEKPDFLKTGDVALVKVQPLRPMVLEKHTEFPPLGRFAIRDMGRTIAAGVVTDVVKA
jgi:elongation factor 1-alpha